MIYLLDPHKARGIRRRELFVHVSGYPFHSLVFLKVVQGGITGEEMKSALLAAHKHPNKDGKNKTELANPPHESQDTTGGNFPA